MPEYFLPRRHPSVDEPFGDAAILDISDGIRTQEGEGGLEIELPQGQRVTIGALPPGTVLEIISWQGTGAPGREASRLILGAVTVGAGSDGASGSEETDAATTEGVAPDEARALARLSSEREATTEPRERRSWRSFRSWFVAAALIAAVGVGPSVLGLGSWSTVDRGPDWALGSTRGSLVLASDERIAGGDRVLVSSPGSGAHVLGFAVNVPDAGLELRPGDIPLDDEAAARVVHVIVPWLGYPAIWFRALVGP
jgi:hypothetical protein